MYSIVEIKTKVSLTLLNECFTKNSFGMLEPSLLKMLSPLLLSFLKLLMYHLKNWGSKDGSEHLIQQYHNSK